MPLFMGENRLGHVYMLEKKNSLIPIYRTCDNRCSDSETDTHTSRYEKQNWIMILHNCGLGYAMRQ